MTFLVEPIWSWPLVALAIVGLLALVLMTYPQRVRHLSPWNRRLLLGLRLATVLVLALAMLRPSVQLEQPDRKSSVLFVISDASRSMNIPDGPGGLTRRQALLRTLADSRPQFEALQRDDVEVRFFDFAEELSPIEQVEDKAEGNQTAIGAVLDAVRREAQSSRVVGVVLMSDGAQRAVPPYDADPRAMARLLGQHRVPVFTVGFGGSGVTDASVDLAVEDLIVDPVAFEKKIVPVNARVRAVGAAGQRVTVRLLVEDRTGKKPGEEGEMQVPSASRNTRPAMQVEVRGNSEVIPVELSYTPDRPGEFKVAVEVVPLEGELRTGNNRRETILSVREGGINIAYFDSVGPEQKFVRMVNREDKIQLDFQPVRGGPFRQRSQIDPEMFQPGRYDAYIIGNVSADTFGLELLRELAARVEEGAGLMMTGGTQSFGPGGYAETPLADLLPVEMNRAERRQGNEVAPDLHHLGQLRMMPTSRGLHHFIMRLDEPAKNRERWEALAPLEGGNRLRPKRGVVEVLAETPEGVPLLLAHEVGQARLMAFAGDTTWQWYLGGHETAHQRFWRQVILWLSRKEMDGDQPVWARVDPRNFTPGQRAPLAFGARDEEGRPVPDAEFTVEVAPPAGETEQVAPRRSGKENTAEFAGTEAAGDYWVRVSARKDGNSLGHDAWTRFIVDARDLEMDNPAADLALLQEISELTGGSLLPPEQLVSFLQHGRTEGTFSFRELSQLNRIALWDNWPFLLLFVGLMTLEWFLRKRRGLV